VVCFKEKGSITTGVVVFYVEFVVFYPAVVSSNLKYLVSSSGSGSTTTGVNEFASS
jgi:hypothetical protein